MPRLSWLTAPHKHHAHPRAKHKLLCGCMGTGWMGRNQDGWHISTSRGPFGFGLALLACGIRKLALQFPDPPMHRLLIRPQESIGNLRIPATIIRGVNAAQLSTGLLLWGYHRPSRSSGSSFKFSQISLERLPSPKGKGKHMKGAHSSSTASMSSTRRKQGPGPNMAAMNRPHKA